MENIVYYLFDLDFAEAKYTVHVESVSDMPDNVAFIHEIIKVSAVPQVPKL